MQISFEVPPEFALKDIKWDEKKGTVTFSPRFFGTVAHIGTLKVTGDGGVEKAVTLQVSDNTGEAKIMLPPKEVAKTAFDKLQPDKPVKEDK